MMTRRGRIVAEGQVPSSRRGFASIVEHAGGKRLSVVIETSTGAETAARRFESLGASVRIVDARKVRLIAETKHKTDRTDAWILADLFRSDALPAGVWRADRSTRELRELVGLRAKLVCQRTELYGKARSIASQEGIRLGQRALCTLDGWDRLMRRRELHASQRDVLAVLRWSVESLTQTIEQIEARFEPYLQRDDVQRLRSIPGVGPIVALTTIARLGELARFPSTRAAAGYTGLIPSERSSGERRRTGRMTRQGPSDLRRVWIQAAQAALRMRQHPAHEWIHRLIYRRGRSVAVVALARRMFCWAFAILRDGRTFDPGLVTAGR
jgi:transposase